MDEIICIKHKSQYSKLMILSSYVGLLIFVIFVYAAIVEGLLFGLFGLPFGVVSLIILSTKSEFQIKPKTREFRVYQTNGVKENSKWLHLDDFPHITIVSGIERIRVYGRSSASVGIEEKHFDVLLLTPSHRVKKLVTTFDSFEKAKTFSEIFCKKYNLNLVKYSPVVSAKTKKRRSSSK